MNIDVWPLRRPAGAYIILDIKLTSDIIFRTVSLEFGPCWRSATPIITNRNQNMMFDFWYVWRPARASYSSQSQHLYYVSRIDVESLWIGFYHYDYHYLEPFGGRLEIIIIELGSRLAADQNWLSLWILVPSSLVW